MKFKKTILAFVATLGLIGLVSCSKNLDNVTTKLNTTARRDRITVVAEFHDEESRIFSSVTPTVYLYEFENNKQGDEIESKTLVNAGDSQNIGKDTTAKEVVFDNLEDSIGKQYNVVVKASIDGYAHTLKTATVSMTDEGTKANPILIKSTDEMSAEEKFLSIQYDRDGYYVLEEDLDFSELKAEGDEVYKLNPMFTTESNSFKGSIDGKNHTIKNFKIESNNQYNGLIGYLEGKVSNLAIENAEITTARTSETNTGLLAGYNAGAISNVEVKNSKVKVESTAYSLTYPLVVGGLVGTVAGDDSDIAVVNSKATNLELTVKAVHRATVGGLIGQVLAPTTIRMGQNISGNNITGLKLTVNQENKTSTKDDILVYVGGFVGSTARTITDSNVAGDIVVTTALSSSATYKEGLKVYNVFVGGFAGLTVDNSRGAGLKNVSFTGKLEADLTPVYTAYVGGLVGAMNGISVTESRAKVELVVKFHKAEEVKPEENTKPTDGEATKPEEKPEEKATYVAGYGYIVGHNYEGAAAGNNTAEGSKVTDTTNLGIAVENIWK